MVIGLTVILTFPVTVVSGVGTSKIVDRGLHSSKLSATIGGALTVREWQTRPAPRALCRHTKEQCALVRVRYWG